MVTKLLLPTPALEGEGKNYFLRICQILKKEAEYDENTGRRIQDEAPL